MASLYLYEYAAGSRYASCGTATVRARALWLEPSLVEGQGQPARGQSRNEMHAGGLASRDRAFLPPGPPKSVPPGVCVCAGMAWYRLFFLRLNRARADVASRVCAPVPMYRIDAEIVFGRRYR